jgi:hypothetical protein
MLFQLYTFQSFRIYSMFCKLCCISPDDGHKGWNMLWTKKKNKEPNIYVMVIM